MYRTRQRGAIGIMAAATLLLSLVCLALVVDTGRLYLEKRKLQRVADMSAMETAAQSGLCGVQSAGGVQAFAQASAQKNGFPADGTLVATLGDVNFDASNTRRQFSPGGQWNDSVRVVAGRTVASSLILNVASVFGANVPTTTTLSATAVARREALGGLSAGSGLASVDSSNSALLNLLLGKLLGTTLNLDVLTYQGVAGANITLLSLGQQLQAAGVSLNLGSVDSLLNANVSVAQLLTAMINAADASQVAGVNTSLLRTALASITVPNAQLTLGSILSVIAPDSARDEAMGADVNLGDLLMATAFVANKNHFIDLNGLSVNVGSLVNANLRLWIIQPPQIAIGYPGKDAQGKWRTQASTAQLNAQVSAQVNLGLATADIGLSLALAQGSAALASIQCGGLGKSTTVDVYAQPGIASLSLGTFKNQANGSGGVDPISVSVLSSSLLKVDVSAQSQVSNPAGATLSFTVTDPEDLPTDPKRASSALSSSLDNALASLASSIDVNVTCLGSAILCLPLNVLLNTLLTTLPGLLRPVVVSLGQAVLDPLLQLLGVDVGNLDVRIIDVQTAGAQLLI
ncbi:pilus assembly protein TadG-related protein [Pseudomonas knackmussii]|uniref:pilus assembly protein TadG-related protein n=1 Tax=Pseudomonas knackmussii TaxID=65741 RepID=UPI001363FA8A|nr:pilus assembly protein TadG-related protein [Pseudomonas knackmussii]